MDVPLDRLERPVADDLVRVRALEDGHVAQRGAADHAAVAAAALRIESNRMARLASEGSIVSRLAGLL